VGCVQTPVPETQVSNGQVPPAVEKPAPPDAKELSAGRATNDTPPVLEKLASEDAPVLAAALDDFAGQKDLPGPRNGRLILVDYKTEKLGSLATDQTVADLQNEHWTLPEGILESLEKRNAKPVSLKDAALGLHIVREDLDALSKDDPEHPHWEFTLEFNVEKKYPDAKNYVWLWAPGYSSDGKTAIVRLSFGPTAHGATATYLLVKEEGKWKVRQRRISLYA
jgi:hypothetical protein